jgi:hypothetical protein
MRVGRLTALVLVPCVVLAACDAGSAGSPHASAQVPSRTASASFTPSVIPEASKPIAAPGEPTSAPSPTSPSVQPTPSGEPTQPSAWTPVRGTAYGSDPAVVYAGTSDGGMYVAVSAGWADDNGTVTLTALDSTGAVRRGWPARLGDEVGPCEIAAAADDSLRLLCDATAYAFDLQGNLLEGWPVDIGGEPWTMAVVGSDLQVQIGKRRWVTVGADGRMSTRTGLTPGPSQYTATIEEAMYRGEPTASRPWRVTLSNSTGVLPGWPVKVPGSASQPVVGTDGTVYLVALAKEGSRLIVISRAGKRLASRTALINDVPPHDGSWYGPYIPQSPVVGSDGSVWVVGGSRAYAFDPQGRLRDGWPAKLQAPLADTGYCSSECDIDCYYLPADPFIDQAGTLYVLRAPTSKAGGGSVLAIGLDGKVVPGWPVSLKRSGSAFWHGSVGPDGSVFVDAYEPEPKVKRTDACFEPASLTMLAIRPDSTVRYRVTLVDP